MFIYKITIKEKVYIGLDTKPSYKLSRWKIHCQNAKRNLNTKLYNAMNLYGIENCKVEILEDNFTDVTSLALAEINYIKKYNSFYEGLNSTFGGDGLGKHLPDLSDDEILLIKKSLGDHFRNYNKNIKWANTSIEDRKELTSHLHTEEIYQKKSNTLKKFYENNPEEKHKKSKGITDWQKDNRDILLQNNRKNSLIGAAKVSKKIKVEKEDGTLLYYKSKSEFNRQTGQWINTIIQKTKLGKFFNGYKAWEI